MRRTILATCLVAGFGLAGCTPPKAQPVAVPTPSPSPTSHSRETQPQPIEVRFLDCGDGDAPCVTYDDGSQGTGLYLVTSQQPFQATLMQACDAEDYPTNLPCVWKRQDAKTGEWITLR